MSSVLSRLLLSLLLILTFSSVGFATELPSSGKLNSAQGNELLTLHLKDNLTILDVRTSAEFSAGHFPNGLHIPLDELSGRISEIPVGPLLIVCRSGRRAQSAYYALIRNGRSPENLWFLSGYTDYSGPAPHFVD